MKSKLTQKLLKSWILSASSALKPKISWKDGHSCAFRGKKSQNKKQLHAIRVKMENCRKHLVGIPNTDFLKNKYRLVFNFKYSVKIRPFSFFFQVSWFLHKSPLPLWWLLMGMLISKIGPKIFTKLPEVTFPTTLNDKNRLLKPMKKKILK